MERSYVPSRQGVVHGEHTADLWLMTVGSSAAECISRMISGVYGVMSEEYMLLDGGKDSLSIESGNMEVLLVELLSEALFLFDAENVIITEPSITILESEKGYRLDLEFVRSTFSIPPGKGGMEVKAATYHEASLIQDADGWSARVLLDL